MMPDVGIDARSVRPIRFDGDDREAVLFNEATSDRCTGSVELRRAVSGLAKKYEICIAKAVEEGAKFLCALGRWQGFKVGPKRPSQNAGVFNCSTLRMLNDGHGPAPDLGRQIRTVELANVLEQIRLMDPQMLAPQADDSFVSKALQDSVRVDCCHAHRIGKLFLRQRQVELVIRDHARPAKALLQLT